MAAPKENIPSFGQLSGTEWNTFTKQKHHFIINSVSKPTLLQADVLNFKRHQSVKVVQLQQRWQELKEREVRAQQRNKELLQQFEKAQDTVKEMLACTAAMKTIRIEYERYLEESSPHWQQQLKEKTQVAQKMRMEECLRSRLKSMEEAEINFFADGLLNSQVPVFAGSMKKTPEVGETKDKNSQNTHSDYSQHVQSSWLTHPQSQTARFLQRASHQPQSSSYIPPLFQPHSHPFMLHHGTSTSSHLPWPRQNAPGWSWTTSAPGFPEALWSQLHTEAPSPESTVSQAAAQGTKTSRASSSKTERCGGSRNRGLSQELDIKPVRLSSGHAESSESGRDSSQRIRERKKKEKKGRSQHTSSEKESHSSEESSRTSSAIIITSPAGVQSSTSDASSGKCSKSESKKRRRRTEARVSESPRIEKVVKEKARRKEEEDSVNESASEESGNQTEESTSKSAGNKSRGRNEKQKLEIISPGRSSAEEEDHNKVECENNNAEEKELSQRDDEPDKRSVEEENEDHEQNEKSMREEKQDDEEEGDLKVFAKENTTEEEEETGAEDEMEEQQCEDELRNEDCENKSSASSQDKEVDDESEQEEKTDENEEGSDVEHDGESEEEEQQENDKAREPEEESDSGDSIITPQKNRMHIVTEEAEEDDGIEKTGKKIGFTDEDDANDSSEEDDIENLLAPQKQKKREEIDLNAAEKPKVSDMKIFQAEDDRSTKSCHHSDSDEFDHFYD